MIQGDRLRRLREQAALSQSRLGSLIGQDQQYVSKLERGALRGMTVETLERLCRALQVSTDYLLNFSCTATVPDSDQTAPQRRPRVLARARGTADAGSPTPHSTAPVAVASPPEASQPPATTSQVAPRCPYCAIPMQPLGEGAGFACQACRYRPQG
jgi:transcriptional regulator with XRE-family HTH domain